MGYDFNDKWNVNEEDVVVIDEEISIVINLAKPKGNPITANATLHPPITFDPIAGRSAKDGNPVGKFVAASITLLKDSGWRNGQVRDGNKYRKEHKKEIETLGSGFFGKESKGPTGKVSIAGKGWKKTPKDLTLSCSLSKLGAMCMGDNWDTIIHCDLVDSAGNNLGSFRQRCRGELGLDGGTPSSIYEINNSPNDEYSIMAEILQLKKNIILEGPPGTGKTHAVGEIAIALDPGGSKLGGKGRGNWGITMHPATSYEEFIEGLRPKKDEEGFTHQPGVFIELIKKAIQNPYQEHIVLLDELNRCNVPRVLGDLLTIIESGKRTARCTPKESESGESVTSSVRVVCLLRAATKGKANVKGYSYSTDFGEDGDEFKFVGVLKGNDDPEIITLKIDQKSRYIKHGSIPKEAVQTVLDKDEFTSQVVFFIVDDIGYPIIANCDFAKHVLDPVNFPFCPHFVEVIDFQGLRRYKVSDVVAEDSTDKTKYYNAKIDSCFPPTSCTCSSLSSNYYWCESCDSMWRKDVRMEVSLSGSKRRLHVPENLLVIGTMNTTDRSIAPLDAALRRRFVFLRLDPLLDFPGKFKNKIKNIHHRGMFVDVVKSWKNLNTQLRIILGRDATIGHSYLFELCEEFAAKPTGDISEIKTVQKRFWQHSILPQVADLLDATGQAMQVWGKIVEDMPDAQWNSLGLKLEPPPSSLKSQAFARTVVIETGGIELDPISLGQVELAAFSSELVEFPELNDIISGNQEISDKLDETSNFESDDPGHNYREEFVKVLKEHDLDIEATAKEAAAKEAAAKEVAAKEAAAKEAAAKAIAPDVEDLSKLTKPELKERCATKGLDDSGIKKKMIDRLERFGLTVAQLKEKCSEKGLSVVGSKLDLVARLEE